MLHEVRTHCRNKLHVGKSGHPVSRWSLVIGEHTGALPLLSRRSAGWQEHSLPDQKRRSHTCLPEGSLLLLFTAHNRTEGATKRNRVIPPRALPTDSLISISLPEEGSLTTESAPVNGNGLNKIAHEVVWLRRQVVMWQLRSLGEEPLASLDVDAIAVKVRWAKRMVSRPILVALGAHCRRPTPTLRSAG